MKWLPPSILFAAMLLSASACRQNPSPDSSPEALSRWPIRPFDDPRCQVNRGDVYEPAARLWKGSGKGQCLDTRWSRPVFRLSEGDAWSMYGLRATTDRWVVANIYDVDRYYVAAIPMNRISAITYQIESLPQEVGTPAGHSMLRVTFSEPIEMRPQFPADSRQRLLVNDLVLSVHAGLGRNQTFDLLNHGLDDSYVVIWGIYTLRNKVKDSLLRHGNVIRQLRLDLTPAQRQKVLSAYVKKSQANSYMRTYNVLTRNCSTEILSNLHETLGVRAPNPPVLNNQALGIISSLVRRGTSSMVADLSPGYAFTALQERGLISGESNRLPNLADDPSVRPLIRDMGRRVRE